MSCLFSDSFGGSQPFHSCWPSSFMMKLDVSTCVAIPEAGWNKKPTIKQISKHPSPPQKRNTTTTTTLPHIILLHILFLLYGCFIHFKLSSSAAIHEVIKKKTTTLFSIPPPLPPAKPQQTQLCYIKINYINHHEKRHHLLEQQQMEEKSNQLLQQGNRIKKPHGNIDDLHTHKYIWLSMFGVI